MAQLVARLVRNEKVRGSNPLSSTIVVLHETPPNLICVLPSGRFSWRVFVLPWFVGVWLIIAAVVLNGPAAAGGVVVVVGVVPAVAVAAVSVLFWVCEFGVVSQGWGGEVVEGWSGCGVDGALWGAGWGVVG